MELEIDKVYNLVSKSITGRLATPLDEVEAMGLAIIEAGPGDHVEIGCLWGGTAIITALLKMRYHRSGHIYTIDPMAGGWWDTQDPMTKQQPTPGRVLDNFYKFGVAHCISIIKARSSPWPLPMDIQPASVYIDGAHEYDSVKLDIKTVKKLGAKVLLFHDYNSAHQGVKQAIDEEFPDPEWIETGSVKTMKIYKRVGE